MITRFGIAGALVAALATQALARADLVTLDQAVEAAIQRNPKVRALLLDVKASRAGQAAESALANPVLTLTPGFTRAGSDEELLLEQPLELNGTRSARAGVARARFAATESRSLGELCELVYATKLAYINLAQAQERLALTREIAASSAELASMASRQVELGSRAGVDKTQLEIEAKRAKHFAALADAEHQSALATLNLMMGERPLTPIEVRLTVGPLTARTAGELAELALASRSELLVSRARQSELVSESRQARASLLPDIVPIFRMASFSRSPKEGGFGIQLSMPLFDYGQIRNQARQATSLLRAEELRMTALQDQVRVEVAQARARCLAARDVLDGYDTDLLADCRKLLESTRAGYALGQTPVAAVLEAQRTYRSVQADRIDVLASYLRAEADLERALGVLPVSVQSQLKSFDAAGKRERK